jgi:predicted RND superfamily exporter protein
MNTNLPIESKETDAFIEWLTVELDERLEGEAFLVGESAIAYEMSLNFPDEFSFISLLTVAAFFIVAAMAFRSFSVSALIVAIIQASVFITMAVMGLTGNGIMYLALIIAQALLKGRVIDYGILYMANYFEFREKKDVLGATIMALNNSIHTIMTSGLIMVVMCFVVGIGFMSTNAAVGEIMLLIALGCAIGLIITIFILPSLTAVFDKWVYQPGKSKKISH